MTTRFFPGSRVRFIPTDEIGTVVNMLEPTLPDRTLVRYERDDEKYWVPTDKLELYPSEDDSEEGVWQLGRARAVAETMSKPDHIDPSCIAYDDLPTRDPFPAYKAPPSLSVEERDLNYKLDYFVKLYNKEYEASSVLFASVVFCVFLIATGLTILVFPGNALGQTIEPLKPRAILVLPPLEYDHPYHGRTMTVTEKSQDEIRQACPKVPFTNTALACTFIRQTSCDILIAPEAEIKAAGYSKNLVLRHEVGHCNGWSGKHDGARRPETKDW